jgi:hypothetical protein
MLAAAVGLVVTLAEMASFLAGSVNLYSMNVHPATFALLCGIIERYFLKGNGGIQDA